MLDSLTEMDATVPQGGSLIKRFFAERGTNPPITVEVERLAKEILESDHSDLALEAIRRRNPEMGLLIAHELIDDGDEVRAEKHAGLRAKILQTLEDGINRAEPDQLPDRLKLLSDLTGRSRSGYTWVPRKEVKGLATRVAGRNLNRVPSSGAMILAKIQNETLD